MGLNVHLLCIYILVSLTAYGQTYNLIGKNASVSDLFVIPDIKMTFTQAQEYCNANYHGLANIYDPNENNIILQLVNLNHINETYIGYYREGTEWKWESNVSSNPMLFLQSPLASISSNIEDPTTICMTITRYGWLYSECDISYNFICETRSHIPEFIQRGSFMLSERKLKFDDARSLCRAQFGADLATIYEEQEYSVAQSLCSNNTVFGRDNQTNCWIGYQRGILNENEWDWIQDLPSNVVPINELINVDLWSIFPWQLSVADVYCQGAANVTIEYSSNGNDFIGNISEQYSLKATYYDAENVLYESILQFRVEVYKGVLPGLKCTIHFEDDLYDTISGDYMYWSIVNSSNGLYDIVEAYTTYNDNENPAGITDDAKWLWNIVYQNKDNVTGYTEVNFQFSFENVKNIQNKPGDDCASISYYPPHKWKTNNCQEKFYAICNAYDHKPVFKTSTNDEFALLTDRQLTREQANSLCQNIYGYGLATIYSFYEFNEINDMLIAYDIDDAWIGLHIDNSTFVDSNNLDNNYGWETQTDFIFDSWTLDIWEGDDAFPDPSYIDDKFCVIQTNGSESEWQLINCNLTSYAICNYDTHEPEFTSSQLGSFYLLESQLQNYENGEEMCRDYVGIYSTGAIIYHPIENERAIWACSNATNGQGCFIGFNNLRYDNFTGFRWKNGALINVFDYPWFGNPWLNISNETDHMAIADYLAELFDPNDTDSNWCTAIMQDEITEEWGWDIVDCDEELNILCDSGDDHAQCWMLQSCSECAIRSDCGWCDGQCQLNDEICYPLGTELIDQEFACDDYDPIINVTWSKDFNYTFTVNITTCASTAPESVSTEELGNYVNYSTCVLQSELIELYIISDEGDAIYGNYEILGKMIQLDQSTNNPGSDTFQNTTTFESQPVCDISVRHGWVRSITCDKNGAGYENNVTQFDMLHDVLRYLLPRLQKRLFQGYDIPEDSLFGYSTMERTYDDSSSDHSIHRVMSFYSIPSNKLALFLWLFVLNKYLKWNFLEIFKRFYHRSKICQCHF